MHPEKHCNLPEWLIREWREIHALEPALFPESRLLNKSDVCFGDKESRLSALCSEMDAMGCPDASHVFLGPWLVTGGAERLALNYIFALVQGNFSGRITLVTTLNRYSPWAKRLPAGVWLLEFGKICSHLSPMDKEDLLTSLLFRWAPRVIHNINSELGFQIFVNHGKALSRTSNLYASSFCMETSPEGHRVGYPVSYLPDCMDHLTAVISENQRHLDELADVYAYDPKKLCLHYQPVDIPEKRRRVPARSGADTLCVLWAGRFDRQKRPDLLIRIAEKSRDLPFHFYVYGMPILNDDSHFKEFSHLGNVTLRGTFDRLQSLPLDEFDILLYTAGWDGMPNILLESAAAGLPVVASHVGGISELIKDSETGFLVSPFDDVDKYIDCLLKIHRDRTLIDQFSKNAFERVSSRHSWTDFVKKIKNIPGYAGAGKLR